MKFIIGFIIGYVLSGLILMADMTSDKNWHKQAIEHKAARFSPITAEFEWLDTMGVGK